MFSVSASSLLVFTTGCDDGHAWSVSRERNGQTVRLTNGREIHRQIGRGGGGGE